MSSRPFRLRFWRLSSLGNRQLWSRTKFFPQKVSRISQIMRCWRLDSTTNTRDLEGFKLTYVILWPKLPRTTWGRFYSNRLSLQAVSNLIL